MAIKIDGKTPGGEKPRQFSAELNGDEVVLAINNPTETAGWQIRVPRDEFRTAMVAFLRESTPAVAAPGETGVLAGTLTDDDLARVERMIKSIDEQIRRAPKEQANIDYAIGDQGPVLDEVMRRYRAAGWNAEVAHWHEVYDEGTLRLTRA
ncbi:MAG: hypothetical protein JNK05_13230 [Myxococcales bacterium]|nr:hypothetical protein [Myxococcales bacterium]